MDLSGGYLPGPLLAALGPRAVLMWRPPAGPTPTQAWTVVDEGAPLEQVLALLASTGSWTQLPDFALVLAEPAGLRVLARGALVVDLQRADGGPVRVGGAQAVTWSESLVAGATSAVITLDGGAAEGEYLPVVAGVVAASAVRWGAGAAASSAATPPPAPPTFVAPAAPLPPVAASSVGATPAAPQPDAAVEQTLPPGTYDLPDAPPVALPDAPDSALPDHDASSLSPVATPDAETSLSYDLLYGTRPHVSPQKLAERAAAVPPAPTEPPPAQPPTPAGAEPQPSTADAPAAATATPAAPEGLLPPVGHHTPSAQPARTPAPGHALITSSPWRLSSAASPDGAAALPLSPSVAAAEATVKRGAAPLAPPDDAAEADDAEGFVDAVRCPQGHLTSPQAPYCRICRIPVPPQAALRVPRPALGVLSLHGGLGDHGTGPRTVTVDRPLVLGRQPRASGLVNGELPALVTLPPPNDDISRSHLQVEIDGWRVLVSDLGSANGTLLQEDGAAPRRLEPHLPTEIGSGARLIFSDDVSATFEAW